MTPRRRKNRALTPIQRRRYGLLLERGVTLQQIADTLKINISAVSRCLRDDARNDKIEAYVSRLCHVDRLELFPEIPHAPPTEG